MSLRRRRRRHLDSIPSFYPRHRRSKFCPPRIKFNSPVYPSSIKCEPSNRRICQSIGTPFPPCVLSLNETDIDLVRKNTAKVFLRIAPTVLHERNNDVLPPYLFVQCNVSCPISIRRFAHFDLLESTSNQQQCLENSWIPSSFSRFSHGYHR